MILGLSLEQISPPKYYNKATIRTTTNKRQEGAQLVTSSRKRKGFGYDVICMEYVMSHECLYNLGVSAAGSIIPKETASSIA